MDVLTTLKRGDHEPYCWPYDGQDDVLVSWLTGESPNPVGGDAPFGPRVGDRPHQLHLPGIAPRSRCAATQPRARLSRWAWASYFSRKG